jgi:hypothetical protein
LTVAGQHRLQQRARVAVGQPLHHQLRQSSKVRARRTGREHQTDRLRFQAARNECQDLRGGAIEPLLVIHQADQRPLVRHVGKEAQDGQADEEQIRRRPGTDAECGAQRVSLRKRHLLETIEHRRAQLMHRREREFHLRLDPHRTLHPAVRRLLDHVIQQRRLAHSRLATHDQRPALACANCFDQLLERVDFAAPASQLCCASSDRRMGGHRSDPDGTPTCWPATTGHWRMRMPRAALTLSA